MNKYLKGKMYPRMGRNYLQKFRELKWGMGWNKKMLNMRLCFKELFKETELLGSGEIKWVNNCLSNIQSTLSKDIVFI